MGMRRIRVAITVEPDEIANGRSPFFVACEQCGATVENVEHSLYSLSKIGHWVYDHAYACPGSSLIGIGDQVEPIEPVAKVPFRDM